jgi:hypothetical protein
VRVFLCKCISILGKLGKSFFSNQYALQQRLSASDPLMGNPELVNLRGVDAFESAIIISNASVSDKGKKTVSSA